MPAAPPPTTIVSMSRYIYVILRSGNRGSTYNVGSTKCDDSVASSYSVKGVVQCPTSSHSYRPHFRSGLANGSKLTQAYLVWMKLPVLLRTAYIAAISNATSRPTWCDCCALVRCQHHRKAIFNRPTFSLCGIERKFMPLPICFLKCHGC